MASSIGPCGRGFIEVVDEEGLRNLIRVSAIQRVCDVDELREEAFILVAGRTIVIRASLDEVREVIEQSASYQAPNV